MRFSLQITFVGRAFASCAAFVRWFVCEKGVVLPRFRCLDEISVRILVTGYAEFDGFVSQNNHAESVCQPSRQPGALTLIPTSFRLLSTSKSSWSDKKLPQTSKRTCEYIRQRGLEIDVTVSVFPAGPDALAYAPCVRGTFLPPTAPFRATSEVGLRGAIFTGAPVRRLDV